MVNWLKPLNSFVIWAYLLRISPTPHTIYIRDRLETDTHITYIPNNFRRYVIVTLNVNVQSFFDLLFLGVTVKLPKSFKFGAVTLLIMRTCVDLKI